MRATDSPWPVLDSEGQRRELVDLLGTEHPGQERPSNRCLDGLPGRAGIAVDQEGSLERPVDRLGIAFHAADKRWRRKHVEVLQRLAEIGGQAVVIVPLDFLFGVFVLERDLETGTVYIASLLF